MIIRPTSSYQLELPDDVIHEIDGRVSSFWIDQRPLLLQLSSFQRTHGTPHAAKRRLLDHIEKHTSAWEHLTLELGQDPTVDQAFAKQFDGRLAWLHGYFVWPHLTVYATVSGPEQEVDDPDNWAISALRSLSLLVQ
jgi:hypothetical protein